LLIKRRRISEKRTAYYMKQLVQGLRYIHTMDITHRDIKPENILIESGVIKICDFGWAIHSIDNQHKGKCGTPLYLSPEVVQDNSYCELVDVWGVGLITY
jgi:serine/threonine protein kinase